MRKSLDRRRPSGLSTAFWHQRQQWMAVSGGRGAGGRVGERGRWFLRHYLRGGRAALCQQGPLSSSWEHGVFARSRNSGCWRACTRPGCRYPRPIAAHFRRSGPTYTANLITEWIEGARTLAGALREQRDAREERSWDAWAPSRRAFHRAGICHADLNASNILIGPRRRRLAGRFRPGAPSRAGRLAQKPGCAAAQAVAAKTGAV